MFHTFAFLFSADLRRPTFEEQKATRSVKQPHQNCETHYERKVKHGGRDLLRDQENIPGNAYFTEGSESHFGLITFEEHWGFHNCVCVRTCTDKTAAFGNGDI